jgi:cell division protease FtsH
MKNNLPPKKQKKGPRRVSNSIISAVLLLLVITLTFSFLITPDVNDEKISINQLVSKINAGEVTHIIARGDELEVTFKDGTEAKTRKEAEAGFSETLTNYGVNKTAFQAVAFEVEDPSGLRFWLSILLPTLIPLIVIIFIFWFIFRQARSGANQAFSFGRSNVKLFSSFKDKVSFKDVAGLKEAKEELNEIVDFLQNPQKYLEIGARIPRGVLMTGPPGTGKTLLARAVAGEAGVPFFHISASEFVEMFVGVGAARTRDAFQTAKKAAPAILFIDEIDAVGRERGAGLGGGHDEREQTLNQILVEMDGFEREAQAIVIAATNRPDVLDKALLRPGRFDRRVFLDLPDIEDREAILKVHTRGKQIAKNIDFRKVAVRTPGFSGADLANLLNEAALLAAKHNRKEVTQDDLFNSIEKVLLGPERRGRIISDQEKKVTAYHEAGHALVGASIKEADPVHKVSIVSRGHAGGYTLNLPVEEVRLKTRKQFLASLAMMMGGYASEKEVFGDISTGASNDLQQASRLARLLVTKFGMSEKIGPISYNGAGDAVFLGRELTMHKDHSEKVASEIDGEIRKLLHAAHKLAVSIIKKRRKVLNAVADALMEKESLEQEAFYEIIGRFKLKPLAV